LKKIIYIVLGLLIGAFISLTLLADAKEVKSISPKEIEDSEPATIEKSENRIILSEIDRLDVLINKLHEKEGYFVTDEKLNQYISSGTVAYGRTNPMFYEKIEVEVTEDSIEDFEVEDTDKFLTKQGESIGYDINKNKLVSIDAKYIEDAFEQDGVMPIAEEYYSVSSGFGLRTDPINTSETRFHIGLDVASEDINGQKIYSALGGLVDIVSYNDKYGNYIVLNHGGFNTIYGHLEGFDRDIKEGIFIDAGKVIGFVGNTGRSTGPHLHFEVEENGVKLNPEHFINIMRGLSQPQKEGYWPETNNEKDKEELEELEEHEEQDAEE
jgi:murein DD-endopeptidase MepM/ murein hydrolase activator NlpD